MKISVSSISSETHRKCTSICECAFCDKPIPFAEDILFLESEWWQKYVCKRCARELVPLLNFLPKTIPEV